MYVKKNQNKIPYISQQRCNLMHTLTGISQDAVFVFLLYILYFQHSFCETNIRIINLPLSLSRPIEAVDDGNVLTLTLSDSRFPTSTWGVWRCCSRCERWTSTPELRLQGKVACTRSSAAVALHSQVSFVFAGASHSLVVTYRNVDPSASLTENSPRTCTFSVCCLFPHPGWVVLALLFLQHRMCVHVYAFPTT